MTQPPPTTSPARAALYSLVLSTAVLVTIEALWPMSVWLARPSLLGGLLLHVAACAFYSLAASMIYGVALILVEAVMVRLRPKMALRILAHAVLAAAMCIFAYRTLLRYEEFKEYPILAVPFVLAFVLITAMGTVLAVPRWRLVAVVLGFIVSVALELANHAILADSYFTFHLSVFQLTLVVLTLTLTHTLARPTQGLSPKRLVLVTMLGAALVAAPFLSNHVATAARPQALLHTLLGRLQVVDAPFSEGAEGPAVAVSADPEGVDRFLKNSGLPELGDRFELTDYNVLLISSEAVRFDRTSLANAALGTTPNLLELAKSGAYWFSNAHSPSSATLPSNAALMSMTYPSATRLDAWSRSWCGELSQDETTVAELFRESGYATFRASHDFHYGFSDNMLGFAQGFAQNELFPEATKDEGLSLDRRIAERAAQFIQEHAGRRFFGWVYFASPHEPYYARYDDWPSATNEQRYLQELRFMDEQLGVLTQALRDAEIFEKTVVIFVADHGEELGDHGGRGHKTLYRECTHVPFLIRIPGQSGGEQTSTTSTLYTFPWLLLHSKGVLRSGAERRAKEELGPMMKAIPGATIAELVSYDKMSTALIYDDRKIVYNFIAGAATAYDLRHDPKEMNDLFSADEGAVSDLLSAVEAYRRVRRGLRRYTLDPFKRPSSRWKKKANGAGRN